MKSIFTLVVLFAYLITFSQEDLIKIELILSVNSNIECDVENVYLTKNDTIAVNLELDSVGNYSTMLDVNAEYQIEIMSKKCLGNNDNFTTIGITKNTRIIREIAVLTGCKTNVSRIYIYYKSESILLQSYIDSNEVSVINFYSNYLKENPNIAIEIKCFRAKNETNSVSNDRAQYIFDELVKKGIKADRLVMVDGGVKEFMHENNSYVSEGIISVIGLGNQSSYLNLKNDLSETYERSSLSSSECIDLIDLAMRKCISDSLILPKYFFPKYSTTMSKILIKEYGFYYNDIIKGDLILPEVMCFEKYMIEATKLKYGVGFIDSLKYVSDSLDKINLGYKQSYFKFDSLNENAYLISKIVEIEKYIKSDYFRIIMFDIEKDGTLTNIKYKEGLYNVIIETRDIKNPEILEELTSIMTNMPRWNPAMLKGDRIKEQKFIILNNLFFNE